ncbi:MAG: hypothetical protein QG629_498 [Patescibacteria group bacterium]|nr:hypothetical protein [Candidatus Saccharibacteria bacterium]MDQ5963416.1 hypothetical protein [Patescibacteria group bacterium]
MQRPSESNFRASARVFLWNIDRAERRRVDAERAYDIAERSAGTGAHMMASYVIVGTVVVQAIESAVARPLTSVASNVISRERYAEGINPSETMTDFVRRRMAEGVLGTHQ